MTAGQWSTVAAFGSTLAAFGSLWVAVLAQKASGQWRDNARANRRADVANDILVAMSRLASEAHRATHNYYVVRDAEEGAPAREAVVKLWANAEPAATEFERNFALAKTHLPHEAVESLKKFQALYAALRGHQEIGMFEPDKHFVPFFTVEREVWQQLRPLARMEDGDTSQLRAE